MYSFVFIAVLNIHITHCNLFYYLIQMPNNTISLQPYNIDDGDRLDGHELHVGQFTYNCTGSTPVAIWDHQIALIGGDDGKCATTGVYDLNTSKFTINRKFHISLSNFVAVFIEPHLYVCGVDSSMIHCEVWLRNQSVPQPEIVINESAKLIYYAWREYQSLCLLYRAPDREAIYEVCVPTLVSDGSGTRRTFHRINGDIEIQQSIGASVRGTTCTAVGNMTVLLQCHNVSSLVVVPQEGMASWWGFSTDNTHVTLEGFRTSAYNILTDGSDIILTDRRLYSGMNHPNTTTALGLVYFANRLDDAKKQTNQSIMAPLNRTVPKTERRNNETANLEDSYNYTVVVNRNAYFAPTENVLPPHPVRVLALNKSFGVQPLVFVTGTLPPVPQDDIFIFYPPTTTRTTTPKALYLTSDSPAVSNATMTWNDSNHVPTATTALEAQTVDIHMKLEILILIMLACLIVGSVITTLVYVCHIRCWNRKKMVTSGSCSIEGPSLDMQLRPPDHGQLGTKRPSALVVRQTPEENPSVSSSLMQSSLESVSVEPGTDTSTIRSIGHLFRTAKDWEPQKVNECLSTSKVETISTKTQLDSVHCMSPRANNQYSEPLSVSQLPIQILKRVWRYKIKEKKAGQLPERR